jgi:hypothetical protein
VCRDRIGNARLQIDQVVADLGDACHPPPARVAAARPSRSRPPESQPPTRVAAAHPSRSRPPESQPPARVAAAHPTDNKAPGCANNPRVPGQRSPTTGTQGRRIGRSLLSCLSRRHRPPPLPISRPGSTPGCAT